ASASSHCYPLSLHDALPILRAPEPARGDHLLVGDPLAEEAGGLFVGGVPLARDRAQLEIGWHERSSRRVVRSIRTRRRDGGRPRSEEHTSELQSQSNLLCRL